MHPAAPVAPGLFALAELRPASGRELLHAFILGVETACRVGLGVMPTHYRRGWHITATCGIFGAAAAARLLGLDARQMRGRSGMPRRNPPGSSRASAACRRASGSAMPPKNGLAAALFAEGGFTGPSSRSRGATGSRP